MADQALAVVRPEGTRQISTIATATSVLRRYTDEDLDVIRKTVAQGASREELAMFLYLANRYELDPFLGEILLIRTKTKQPDGSYKEALRLYVPRDGWLKVASRHPEYEGLESAPVHEKDVFEADYAEGKVTHKITSPVRGRILGAYAIAYRKGRKPYLAVVSLEEVRGRSSAWETHPGIMAQTRAEVYAIRRQFQITGLYAPEEFGHASETIREQAQQGVVIEGEFTVEEEPQPGIDEPVTPEEYNRVYAEAKGRGWTPAQIRNVYRQITGHNIRDHRPTREEFVRFRQALAGPPPTQQKGDETETTGKEARTDSLPF